MIEAEKDMIKWPNAVDQNWPLFERLVVISAKLLIHQRRKFPSVVKLKALTMRAVIDGALELERVVREDGYDLETEVLPALRWGLKDDAFWSGRLLSCAQIRKRAKNGLRKFQNLLAAHAMEKHNENGGYRYGPDETY